MKSSFSEQQLIDDFCKIIGNTSGQSNLIIGIGDDAAAYKSEGFTVQTTDALVENIHFDLSYTSFYDLGWKAIAVNQSDLAAMGAVPKYFLITIGIPKSVDRNDLIELYKGFKEILNYGGGEIIGGDLVKSNELFISVSATGFCQMDKTDPLLMRRDSAKPGELVAVTGSVGNSGGGLKLLKSNSPDFKSLKDIHLKPQPKVKEGLLFSELGVKTCIDISDGLVTDATRISKASNVSITLDTDNIPITNELKKAFPDNWLNLSLNGGEDFELIITGTRELVLEIKKQPDIKLTIIGSVEKRSSKLLTLLESDKSKPQLQSSGWDHFKNNDI